MNDDHLPIDEGWWDDDLGCPYLKIGDTDHLPMLKLEYWDGGGAVLCSLGETSPDSLRVHPLQHIKTRGQMRALILEGGDGMRTWIVGFPVEFDESLTAIDGMLIIDELSSGDSSRPVLSMTYGKPWLTMNHVGENHKDAIERAKATIARIDGMRIVET